MRVLKRAETAQVGALKFLVLNWVKQNPVYNPYIITIWLIKAFSWNWN